MRNGYPIDQRARAFRDNFGRHTIRHGTFDPLSPAPQPRPRPGFFGLPGPGPGPRPLVGPSPGPQPFYRGPVPFKPRPNPKPFNPGRPGPRPGRLPMIDPGSPKELFRFMRRANLYGFLFDLWLQWMLDKPPATPQLFDKSRFVKYFGPCIALQEVQLGDMKTCGLKQVQPVVPAGTLRFATFGQTVGSSGGFPTAQMISHWVEIVPAELTPLPVKHPAYLPVPMLPGVIMPAADPFALPPLAPVPTPRPIPHRFIPRRRPRPDRDPQEQPHWGPGPERKPRRRVLGGAGPGIDLRPGIDPPQPPIVIGPPRPPRPPFLPPQKPTPRPPPPRTKERKFHVSIDKKSIGGKIAEILGEAAEWIGVFWEAIPQPKPKGLSASGKAAYIYSHFDRVNMERVMQNVIWNEIEDRFYGEIGKRAGEAARNLQQSKGLQLGGAGRKYITKVRTPGEHFDPQEWFFRKIGWELK